MSGGRATGLRRRAVDPASGRAAAVAGLAALVAVAAAGPAFAQVTTNSGALRDLAPAASSSHGAGGHHRAASRTDHRAERRAVHQETRSRHGTASRPTTHPAARAVPTMPLHPPPPPVIAPPAIHVPLHPPPPPPAVPVDKTATGSASVTPGGVTVLAFEAGGSGLNASMMAAVRQATDTMLAQPSDIAVIDSYAAGTPDDPSTPRRLSLQRALAVRAVMINAGVASTRIFARADGAPAPGAAGDPDRTFIAERDQNRPGAFAPVTGETTK